MGNCELNFARIFPIFILNIGRHVQLLHRCVVKKVMESLLERCDIFRHERVVEAVGAELVSWLRGHHRKIQAKHARRAGGHTYGGSIFIGSRILHRLDFVRNLGAIRIVQ